MVEKTCFVRLSPQLLRSQDPVYLSLAIVAYVNAREKEGFSKTYDYLDDSGIHLVYLRCCMKNSFSFCLFLRML